MVTFLMGLLIGLVVLIAIGAVIYLTSQNKKEDATNYFTFGLVAAIIAYIILVIFFASGVLKL